MLLEDCGIAAEKNGCVQLQLLQVIKDRPHSTLSRCCIGPMPCLPHLAGASSGRYLRVSFRGDGPSLLASLYLMLERRQRLNARDFCSSD